jgi:hypothetical protein
MEMNGGGWGQLSDWNPNSLYIYKSNMNLIWAFRWASRILTKAGLISGPPPKLGGIFGGGLLIRPTSVNIFTEVVVS